MYEDYACINVSDTVCPLELFLSVCSRGGGYVELLVSMVNLEPQ